MSNPATRRVARKRFRRSLESWGMDPEEIELCVEQYKQRQLAKARGELSIKAPLCTRAEYVRLLKKTQTATDAAVFRLGEDYEPPDDKGYKPPKIDSVLTGVGRATGETARAIKRGKTITKYDYDQNNKDKNI